MQILDPSHTLIRLSIRAFLTLLRTHTDPGELEKAIRLGNDPVFVPLLDTMLKWKRFME